VTTGIWELSAYNKLQLKLDNFANGEFEIKNKGIKKRHLISEKNIIPSLSGSLSGFDTTYTRIQLIKE
jgi:hypothetical protein